METANKLIYSSKNSLQKTETNIEYEPQYR